MCMCWMLESWTPMLLVDLKLLVCMRLVYAGQLELDTYVTVLYVLLVNLID